tara:strand:- start:145 stop:492 length:348 start_codon:yes stop_codon:yes gene_type:complete
MSKFQYGTLKVVWTTLLDSQKIKKVDWDSDESSDYGKDFESLDLSDTYNIDDPELIYDLRTFMDLIGENGWELTTIQESHFECYPSIYEETGEDDDDEEQESYNVTIYHFKKILS